MNQYPTLPVVTFCIYITVRGRRVWLSIPYSSYNRRWITKRSVGSVAIAAHCSAELFCKSQTNKPEFHRKRPIYLLLIRLLLPVIIVAKFNQTFQIETFEFRCDDVGLFPSHSLIPPGELIGSTARAWKYLSRCILFRCLDSAKAGKSPESRQKLLFGMARKKTVCRRILMRRFMVLFPNKNTLVPVSAPVTMRSFSLLKAFSNFLEQHIIHSNLLVSFNYFYLENRRIIYIFSVVE